MKAAEDSGSIVELERRTATRIRHALSNGLSFLDSSSKSASAKNVDYSMVVKLQGYGIEKVRLALAELDKALTGSN